MNPRPSPVVRIVLGVALLASLFFWSFWVTLFLAMLGLIFIPNYGEFLVVTVALELLYRGGSETYPFILAYLPVVAIIVYVIVETLRSSVREHVLRA